MSEFQFIEARWGISVPESYGLLWKSGAIDASSPNYLRLTQIKDWFDPPMLAGFDVPDFWKPGVVPFARSSMGDYWLWVSDWSTAVGVGVAFAPHGFDTATGYASNHAAMVYRALVEECHASQLGEMFGVTAIGVAATLGRYVDIVTPVLHNEWIKTLRSILSRSPSVGDMGIISFISRSEADDLIRRDLAFAHLDEEFAYMVD